MHCVSPDCPGCNLGQMAEVKDCFILLSVAEENKY